jgi:hypothetical protein
MSYFHFRDNVTPLKNDSRILIEQGCQANGQKIADKLDSVILAVQGFFQSPFLKPVYITLCSSEKSHMQHCGDVKNSRGMMNWGRIFIAPAAFESNAEIPILIHELVHLHIYQNIGIFKFYGDVPLWFSEGIAVMISQGAGAEDYSDSEAVAWIKEGKCFTPIRHGNLLNPSGENDSQLPWDMFYRQAYLFVSYLEKTKSLAFKLFLSDIEKKMNFQKAFVKNFNNDVTEEFINFKRSLRAHGTVKR